MSKPGPRIVLRKTRFIALFFLMTLVAACRAPYTRRYPLVGEIVGIDRRGHQLIIRHEDIPNFMKGMTMPFVVKDDKILDRVQVGQRIKATLAVTETTSWLEDVQVAAPAPADVLPPKSELRIPSEGQTVPDFVFTNQDDRRIHLSQYRGKAVLLTFIYTRCPLPDYCPRMTHNFVEIEKALKQDPAAYDRIHLLSISFDPEFDNPKVLRQHALALTSIPASELFRHWEFVVPQPKDLDAVARFFALSQWKEDEQIVHSLSTAIIDPDGKIWRWYHGNGWTTEEVLRETRAAAGKLITKR
jgi:protein SCO1